MADHDVEAVNFGRLARLKFTKNHHAREDALRSIRQNPRTDLWHVRIGGRMRGQTRYFSTREQAEKAVNDHYNDQMMQFIQKRRTP